MAYMPLPMRGLRNSKCPRDGANVRGRDTRRLVLMHAERNGSDDGFGYWLSGFLDGEACFVITNTGHRFIPLLDLKVRDDDAELIEEIVRRTGAGWTYRRGKHGRSNPMIGWRVSKKADLLALVGLLDAHPMRSRKRADYDVWREAVLIYAQPRRGWYALDWTVMRQFKVELEAGRVYQG